MTLSDEENEDDGLIRQRRGSSGVRHAFPDRRESSGSARSGGSTSNPVLAVAAKAVSVASTSKPAGAARAEDKATPPTAPTAAPKGLNLGGAI